MSQPNEVVPQGPLYGWSKVPTVSRGVDITDASLPAAYLNAPNNGALYGTWPYALAWAVVTADSGLQLSAQGGVILRDMCTHVFRTSTQRWELLAHSAIPGGGYLHNTSNYADTAQGDLSIVEDSGVVARPPVGWAFEVWNYRALLPVGDFSAVASSVSLRLHPSTPPRSGFGVQCGMDYYPWQSGSIPGIVPGVGTGRIVRAVPGWRTASMLVGTSAGIPFDVPTCSYEHTARSD